MTAADVRRRMEARYGQLPSFAGGLGSVLDLEGLSAHQVPIGSFADDGSALARDLAEIGKDLRQAVIEVTGDQGPHQETSSE